MNQYQVHLMINRSADFWVITGAFVILILGLVRCFQLINIIGGTLNKTINIQKDIISAIASKHPDIVRKK